MMLKQLMNRHCGFWNPENHRDHMDSGTSSLSEERKAELVKLNLEWEKKKKVRKLTNSLILLSQTHEVIEALGEDLPPLAITALGNIAEQAASTLKLLEKGK